MIKNTKLVWRIENPLSYSLEGHLCLVSKDDFSWLFLSVAVYEPQCNCRYTYEVCGVTWTIRLTLKVKRYGKIIELDKILFVRRSNNVGRVSMVNHNGRYCAESNECILDAIPNRPSKTWMDAVKENFV